MTAAILLGADIAKATSDAPILANGYRNNRTIWMLPTFGMIPYKVFVSLRNMSRPMNTPVLPMEKLCKEVGVAYEEMTALAMEHPECERYPFIWTYEEDNIQPPDVLLRLLDAMWTCPDCQKPMPSVVGPGDRSGDPAEPWECEDGHAGWDAVGALYFTKSVPRIAMAYGDPTSPDLEMRPRDVREAMKEKSVIEVNGVAMGSTIFRKALFAKTSRPWFKTLPSATQDLYFCRKAKDEARARGERLPRFGVHCGVVVGHLDVKTNVIY